MVPRRSHGRWATPSRGAPRCTARLALHVVGARLDGLHDGLLVFFVGVVLLRVAAAVYFLTHLLVAAAPVVMLASRVTVAGPTSNASRRVVGQWGGTGGACCEDHFAVAGRPCRARASRAEKNRVCLSPASRRRWSRGTSLIEYYGVLPSHSCVRLVHITPAHNRRSA